MRHALAPGIRPDPPGFRLGDCATQRNLSDEGRELARRTGAELARHGFRATRVLTSEWCRCRETAELLSLGPVETMPMLNMFFPVRTEKARQQEAMRAERENVALERYLAGLGADERVVLVTHSSNIAWMTRGDEPKSGAGIVLKLDSGGKHRVVGVLEFSGK